MFVLGCPGTEKPVPPATSPRHHEPGARTARARRPSRVKTRLSIRGQPRVVFTRHAHNVSRSRPREHPHRPQSVRGRRRENAGYCRREGADAGGAPFRRGYRRRILPRPLDKRTASARALSVRDNTASRASLDSPCRSDRNGGAKRREVVELARAERFSRASSTNRTRVRHAGRYIEYAIGITRRARRCRQGLATHLAPILDDDTTVIVTADQARRWGTTAR